MCPPSRLPPRDLPGVLVCASCSLLMSAGGRTSHQMTWQDQMAVTSRWCYWGMFCLSSSGATRRPLSHLFPRDLTGILAHTLCSLLTPAGDGPHVSWSGRIIWLWQSYGVIVATGGTYNTEAVSHHTRGKLLDFILLSHLGMTICPSFYILQEGYYSSISPRISIIQYNRQGGIYALILPLKPFDISSLSSFKNKLI